MSGSPSLQRFLMFTELRGTDVWRQSIHVYRRSLKTASPDLWARRSDLRDGIREVMTWPLAPRRHLLQTYDDSIRSREIHGSPISRAVLQIALWRAIVWATAIPIYCHRRRLTRHAERTDWPA